MLAVPLSVLTGIVPLAEMLAVLAIVGSGLAMMLQARRVGAALFVAGVGLAVVAALALRLKASGVSVSIFDLVAAAAALVAICASLAGAARIATAAALVPLWHWIVWPLIWAVL